MKPKMKEPRTNNNLKSAIKFAKKKHACMKRKDGKTPYWKHLEKVVDNLRIIGIRRETLLCAGWLHDTIEDTDTDFDDIAEKFGIDTAEIVAEVTKDKRLPEDERERQYVRQLKNASPEACLIKFCDVWANIADLPSGYAAQGKIREQQVSKKLLYLKAIKKGLATYNKASRTGSLQKGVDALNHMLDTYGKRITL